MMQAQIELEEVMGARAPIGYGGSFFYGAYPALVVDVRDPDHQGRVKVALPWAPDTGGSSYQAWARVATMMAGSNQGTWFIPDKNVEVLVIFLAGDPRQPCVIGALWNGKDAPPQTMDGAGSNNIKKIRSRSGVAITLDDTPGAASLTLETPLGQTIAMKDGTASIRIEDSNGNFIQMDSSGITIEAPKVSISTSQTEVTANMVNVNSGMSVFSGITQHDSVITNSVVSQSYTPGAGNMW